MPVVAYVLAIIALAVGTAAVYMALLQQFPVQWLYYHYFVRKPIVWTILIGFAAWVCWESWRTGRFPVWSIVPLAMMGLAVVLTYRLHQEAAFQAVDFPSMSRDLHALPLTDERQLAVINYGGVLKAYPLDYVIHHHIINDRFGQHLVALTYCAMCRSIIPFDVSEIGPLFVASFKNANMIVADRRTRTFFQQATFASVVGKLHPRKLTMLPVQILPWGELKRLNPPPQVANVTEADLQAFELPIPGIWRRIMASETTPGLPRSQRDNTFRARTQVVGIIDPIADPPLAYLKDELLKRGVVRNRELDLYLVAINNTVNAFRGAIKDRTLSITLSSDNTLLDSTSGTVWDPLGKHISGPIQADLRPVAISDEYWFSWKRFHPTSKLLRL